MRQIETGITSLDQRRTVEAYRDKIAKYGGILGGLIVWAALGVLLWGLFWLGGFTWQRGPVLAFFGLLFILFTILSALAGRLTYYELKERPLSYYVGQLQKKARR